MLGAEEAAAWFTTNTLVAYVLGLASALVPGGILTYLRHWLAKSRKNADDFNAIADEVVCFLKHDLENHQPSGGPADKAFDDLMRIDQSQWLAKAVAKYRCAKANRRDETNKYGERIYGDATEYQAAIRELLPLLKRK